MVIINQLTVLSSKSVVQIYQLSLYSFLLGLLARASLLHWVNDFTGSIKWPHQVSKYLLWFGCRLASNLTIKLLYFHLKKFLFFLDLGHFNRVDCLSLLFNLSASLLLVLLWGCRLSLLGGWDCGGRDGSSGLERYFPHRWCMSRLSLSRLLGCHASTGLAWSKLLNLSLSLLQLLHITSVHCLQLSAANLNALKPFLKSLDSSLALSITLGCFS